MSFKRNQTTINSEPSSPRESSSRSSADATNPSLELTNHIRKEDIETDHLGRPCKFLCRCDLVKQKYLEKKNPGHACGQIPQCRKVFTSIQALIDHLGAKWILCQHEACNTVVFTNFGKWTIMRHLMGCHPEIARELTGSPPETDMETLQRALNALPAIPFYNNRTGIWQLENPWYKKSDISTETVQAAITGAVSVEAIPAAISSTVDAALSGSDWCQVGRGKKQSKPVEEFSDLTQEGSTNPVPLVSDQSLTKKQSKPVEEFPDLTQEGSTNPAPLVSDQSLTKTQAKKLKKLGVKPASSPVVDSTPVGESTPVVEPTTSLVVEPVARTLAEFVDEKIATQKQKQAERKASTVGKTVVVAPVSAPLPAAHAIVSKVMAKPTKSKLETVVEAEVESATEAKPVYHQTQRLLEKDIELEQYCPYAYKCQFNCIGKGDETCQLNHTTCLRHLHRGTWTPINFCRYDKECKNIGCTFDHSAGRVAWATKAIAWRKMKAERPEVVSVEPTVVAKPVSSLDARFGHLVGILEKYKDAPTFRTQVVTEYFKTTSATPQEKYDQLIVLLQIENDPDVSKHICTAYANSTSS